MAGPMKQLYRNILRMLPDKPAVYLIYFRGYRKLLNLKNPRYYGEKIQWLKLYGNLEAVADYVDKYKVRDYVKETVGEQYLNGLYGVYDTPEQIDYDTLPRSFVLKCTNGSGHVLVVKDKNKLDVEKANRQMHGWLKDDFYKMKKEPQYKPIQNRIIAVEYLGSGLREYKFWCFDGEPYFYEVVNYRTPRKEVGQKTLEEAIDVYDMTGKKLPVQNANVKPSDEVTPQPDNFGELTSVVRKLAEPFSFVRVDFYVEPDRLYFGELTFTDGAGSDPFYPMTFDREIAEKISLGEVLKQK